MNENPAPVSATRVESGRGDARPCPRPSESPKRGEGSRPVPTSARRAKSRTLYDRRRRPGEVPTLATAVQNHCRECCGWDSGGSGSVTAAVRDCEAVECWLWPWRTRGFDAEAWER